MKEHVKHLQLTLEVLKQHTSLAKLSKCGFSIGEVAYLRHLVSTDEVSTDLDKLKAIRDGLFQLP